VSHPVRDLETLRTSRRVHPKSQAGTSGAPGVRVAYVARTLELNLVPGGVSSLFDEFRLGPASELVPAWGDEVTHGGPQG
jgi:hypothetical protein